MAITERPFEPLSMETADWKHVPIRLVRVRELHPAQDGLTWEGLFATEPYSGDRWPHIVRYQGDLFISDGHHRIARAVFRGQRWILARVLDKDGQP